MLESVFFGGLIFLLTQFIKKYIEPRFGKEGVIMFVMILSFVIASVEFIAKSLLPEEYIRNFWVIVSSAIAIYEIFYKRIYSIAKEK